VHRVSEGGWTADRPEPLERSVHWQALASVQRALDVEPRLAMAKVVRAMALQQSGQARRVGRDKRALRRRRGSRRDLGS